MIESTDYREEKQLVEEYFGTVSGFCKWIQLLSGSGKVQAYKEELEE